MAVAEGQSVDRTYSEPQWSELLGTVKTSMQIKGLRGGRPSWDRTRSRVSRGARDFRFESLAMSVAYRAERLMWRVVATDPKLSIHAETLSARPGGRGCQASAMRAV